MSESRHEGLTDEERSVIINGIHYDLFLAMPEYSKTDNIYIQKLKIVYKLVNIVKNNCFQGYTMLKRGRCALKRDPFKKFQKGRYSEGI